MFKDASKHPGGGGEWPPKYGTYYGQETGGIAGQMIDQDDDGSVATCDVEKSGKTIGGFTAAGGNVREVCRDGFFGGGS